MKLESANVSLDRHWSTIAVWLLERPLVEQFPIRLFVNTMFTIRFYKALINTSFSPHPVLLYDVAKLSGSL